MVFGVYKVVSNAATTFHENDIPGELSLIGCCEAPNIEAAIKEYDETHAVAFPLDYLK